MGISKYPSTVTMPKESAGCSSVLEFLIRRFPGITPSVWLQRIQDGKVLWDDNTTIAEDSAYMPQRRILYYREVEQEPPIPGNETILYQDENLLVADKPHFLPVIPNGIYVNQCLLYRLRKHTGMDDLTPIHRIDRWTAGVVIFSTNPKTRNQYHNMFSQGQVSKLYHGVARIPSSLKQETSKLPTEWQVENRLAKGKPRFRMEVRPGEVNARSRIKCIAVHNGMGMFHLHPLTGKTHQLRLHMSGLGMPLLNERYYPELQPKSADNFDQPLQLLAKQLQFIDPITSRKMSFSSSRDLVW
ncbi:MAG: pseudouridine synthase [Gammaproteobacteria bacterium]|nr:pseudouridine synthase [Gammaproteobacteria bacterium]